MAALDFLRKRQALPVCLIAARIIFSFNVNGYVDFKRDIPIIKDKLQYLVAISGTHLKKGEFMKFEKPAFSSILIFFTPSFFLLAFVFNAADFIFGTTRGNFILQIIFPLLTLTEITLISYFKGHQKKNLYIIILSSYFLVTFILSLITFLLIYFGSNNAISFIIIPSFTFLIPASRLIEMIGGPTTGRHAVALVLIGIVYFTNLASFSIGKKQAGKGSPKNKSEAEQAQK